MCIQYFLRLYIHVEKNIIKMCSISVIIINSPFCSIHIIVIRIIKLNCLKFCRSRKKRLLIVRIQKKNKAKYRLKSAPDTGGRCGWALIHCSNSCTYFLFKSEFFRYSSSTVIDWIFILNFGAIHCTPKNVLISEIHEWNCFLNAEN